MEFKYDLCSNLWGNFPPQNVPFLSITNLHANFFLKNSLRHLALVLAYDGTNFAGWQLQPGLFSIQGELEKNLSQLCNHPIRVYAASRTDAGVHAWGQVISFNTYSHISIKDMLKGLRSLLPPEIFPRTLGYVHKNFHARYSSKAKTYNYYLWPQAGPSLFQRKRIWPLKYPLMEETIRQALDILPGLRDIRAFAYQGNKFSQPIFRKIIDAKLDIEARGPWCLTLTADGFLRYVVRNLVSTLIQVGIGRLQPIDIVNMFTTDWRPKPVPKAPAYGLYLSRIYY